MFLSDGIRHGYGIFSVFLLISLLLFFLAIQTEKGRYLWDKSKLHFPIFGPLLSKGVLSQFSRTLSILSKSGLPIIQSIKIISDSISNVYIEKKIQESTYKIQRGATITEAFNESEIFPELMVQMISSGEESGTLVTMLSKIADFYQQQIDTTIAAFSSIIEPFLIVIIGVLVGSFAIAIFLPIFKMGGVIR